MPEEGKRSKDIFVTNFFSKKFMLEKEGNICRSTMTSKWVNTTVVPKRLTKQDKEYGTPVPGSKTEARGKLAQQRVSREIWELCCVIQEHGITRKRQKLKKRKPKATEPTIESRQEENSSTNEEDEEEEYTQTSKMEFGRLFSIYNYISNKLVGILLRARKYGLVTFEGETLFQRQDDDVIITLLYPASKVKKMLDEKTFTWGKCM